MDARRSPIGYIPVPANFRSRVGVILHDGFLELGAAAAPHLVCTSQERMGQDLHAGGMLAVLRGKAAGIVLLPIRLAGGPRVDGAGAIGTPAGDVSIASWNG